MCSALQVLVLENVRFYKEETKNDPGFAEKVHHCALADNNLVSDSYDSNVSQQQPLFDSCLDLLQHRKHPSSFLTDTLLLNAACG